MATHPVWRRTYPVALLMLVPLLLISGCRSKDAETGKQAPPETVAICVGGAPGIPAVLAQELGLFARKGVTATLKKYTAGPLAFEGALAGDCEMTIVGETPVVMKSFERQDFSILATLAASDDSTRVLANAARGIRRPEDLKGKRIFVHKGSTNHYFLEMFLLRNGLSAKDVSLIFQNPEDVSAALLKGSIDAFTATEVLINKPRKALGDKAVVFRSPGLCRISFNLVAGSGFVREKPKAAVSVLAALIESVDAIAKDRPRAIQALSRSLNVKEDEMAGMLDGYSWHADLAQTLLLSLEQEARWAISVGLTQKTTMPNYLDFIDAYPLRILKPEAVTMLKQ